MNDKERLHYLDNIKVFLIILVVIHHVGQAYGSTGGSWYYSYPDERVRSLGLFFLFNASFFMGLFFFISGYFLPGSFDRHGARKRLRQRQLMVLPQVKYRLQMPYRVRSSYLRLCWHPARQQWTRARTSHPFRLLVKVVARLKVGGYRTGWAN